MQPMESQRCNTDCHTQIQRPYLLPDNRRTESKYTHNPVDTCSAHFACNLRLHHRRHHTYTNSRLPYSIRVLMNNFVGCALHMVWPADIVVGIRIRPSRHQMLAHHTLLSGKLELMNPQGALQGQSRSSKSVPQSLKTLQFNGLASSSSFSAR